MNKYNNNASILFVHKRPQQHTALKEIKLVKIYCHNKERLIFDDKSQYFYDSKRFRSRIIEEAGIEIKQSNENVEPIQPLPVASRPQRVQENFQPNTTYTAVTTKNKEWTQSELQTFLNKRFA